MSKYAGYAGLSASMKIKSYSLPARVVSVSIARPSIRVIFGSGWGLYFWMLARAKSVCLPGTSRVVTWENCVYVSERERKKSGGEERKIRHLRTRNIFQGLCKGKSGASGKAPNLEN